MSFRVHLSQVCRLAVGALTVVAVTAVPVFAQNDPCGVTLEGVVDTSSQSAYGKACSLSSNESASNPKCDRWWNLRQTGILKAREILAARPGQGPCTAGKGVVVGHIDSGIVDDFSFKWNPLAPLDLESLHPLIKQRSLLRVLTTTKDGELLPMSFSPGPEGTRACQSGRLATHGLRCAPRDPDAQAVPRDRFPSFALPLLSNAGHGTRTLDVLLQAAPALAVVPYRFASAIVATQGRSLQLEDAIVSAALEDRLSAGTGGRIDVITMSIGRRSPSEELDRAILLAESRGVVLVAAAGQWIHPGTRTRFPGQSPGVVAVTGITSDLVPWSKAGRGPHNNIAAPAVDVWLAGWGGKDNDDRRVPEYTTGSGTSFATPLVAATAAMWIQFHGRDVLDQKYGRSAVPAAFRLVLKKSGHRSPKQVCADILLKADPSRWADTCATAGNWDQANWGKGILAADLVLQADLPTRDDVCREIFLERGALAEDVLCGKSASTGIKPELLTERTHVRVPSAWTYVLGASVYGSSFSGGAKHPGMSPSLSFGVIASGHDNESPIGWLSQVELGARQQKLSLGRGYAVEYAAVGPNRSLDIFPIFSPTLGAAVKVSVVRDRVGSDDHHVDSLEHAPTPRTDWWVGPEAQLTYYRVRLQLSAMRSVTKGPIDRWRLTWRLGIGF